MASGAAYEVIDDLTTSRVPGSSPPRHVSDYLQYEGDGWRGEITVSLADTGAGRPLTPCPGGNADGACDYVLDRRPGRVHVAMTDPGLRAIAAARANSPGSAVRITAQARVTPGVAGAAAPVEVATSADAAVLRLPNTALLIPSGRAKRSGITVVSNTVTTLYGALRLHKVDRATSVGLAGARLTLYRTRDDALARRDPLAESPPTEGRGLARIPGLHVSDYQNDTFARDSYWLVETTTPAGYAADSEPREVRVLMDGSTAWADRTGGYPIPNDRTSSGVDPPPGEQPPDDHEPPGDEPPTSDEPGSSDGDDRRSPPGLPFTGLELGIAVAVAALLLGGGRAVTVASRRRDRGR